MNEIMPAFYPAFFSLRSSCNDIDELIMNMAERFPNIEKETLANMCVALEKSILMDFQPTSALDFQHELSKQYFLLQELTKKVENIIHERWSESDDQILETISPMLNILKVAKDYLKLILDAQKEFYNAKEMQNFMDTILDVLANVSPEIKESVLSRLAEKKMIGK